MKTINLKWATMVVGLVSIFFITNAYTDGTPNTDPALPNYVILTTTELNNIPDNEPDPTNPNDPCWWKHTINKIRDRHQTGILGLSADANVSILAVQNTQDFSGMRDGLNSLHPRYVAVVLRPEDIDINFARQFLMMSTELDSDPFSDFSYGFITGATGQDALDFVTNIYNAEAGVNLPGNTPIQDWPLSISACGIWGISQSDVLGQPPFNAIFAYLTTPLPVSNPVLPLSPCSHIRLKIDDDPSLNKDFFFSHINYLSNKKLIFIQGNGDPHMAWLFDENKQNKHFMLPDNWNFDPDLVENPPVQRNGITSDDIRQANLYPAVVYNGVCHSGVLKHILNEGGDITGTFGDPNGIQRFCMIQNPDFSYALSILKTGITGYFAPLGPNRVCMAEEDIIYTLNSNSNNKPLGDIYKQSIDSVVMGFLGNRPNLAVYREGDSTASSGSGVFTSGTYNPSRFVYSYQMMLSGKANRVYYGDPMFNPFIHDTSSQFITPNLEPISGDPNRLRLTLHINKIIGEFSSFQDLYHRPCGEGERSHICATVDISSYPEFKNGVHIDINTADLPIDPQTGQTLRCDPPIYALEKFDDKTFLHLEIDTLKSANDAMIFDIPLTITKTPVIWHYDLLSNSNGSAAAADIDNDGKQEIVFGTYLNDGKLYALNAEDGSLLWSFQTGEGGRIDSSVAIADVNRDGKKEVIFSDSYNKILYCLNSLLNGPNGGIIWQYQLRDCTDSPPAVGDIDNDGKAEVVVGDKSGWLYMLNGEQSPPDGRLFREWRYPGAMINSGATLVDLNSDGVLDIVFASFSSALPKVYAVDGVNGLELWSVQAPFSMYHSPACADIDHDTKPELIFTSGNQLYIVNGEVPLPGGENRILVQETIPSADIHTESLCGPISIADLNNDGNLEIVMTGQNIYSYSYQQRRVLWHYDNFPDFIRFPDLPPNRQWERNLIARGAVIADMDDDGKPDVVFGNRTGKLTILKGNTAQATGEVLYIFDAKADFQRDYPERQYFDINHAPLIGNFDGDNGLDIFFIGGQGYSDIPPYDPPHNYGRAYLIRGRGGMGKGWHMFRHDLVHSGSQSYVPPPSIDRVDITPSSAYKMTTLTATPFGWHDPDAKQNLTYTYQWYKKTNGYGNYMPIEGATSNRLSPENFNKGDAIRCEVIPHNILGDGSPKMSASVTILNTSPITWIRSPIVLNSYSNQIKIRWDSTDPDDGDDLSNVEVKYYPSGAGGISVYSGANAGSHVWDCTGAANSTNGKITVKVYGNQNPGTAYYVSPFNINNDSNSSPIIRINPSGNKTINEGEALTFSVIGDDPDAADTLTFSASNLPAGASFQGQTFTWTPAYTQAGRYNVIFTVSDGTHKDSEVITIAVNNVPGPPDAPSDLTATVRSLNQIDLNWTDRSNNEQGFHIFRTPANGGVSRLFTVGAGVTTFSDTTGLIRGTPYLYTVTAFNDARPSGPSNTVRATILPAPSNLTAAGSSRQINLSWTYSPNCQTGFAIERSPNGVDTWTYIGGVYQPNVTTFTNTGLSPGTAYHYRVRARAYNRATGSYVYSDYSNVAHATVNP